MVSSDARKEARSERAGARAPLALLLLALVLGVLIDATVDLGLSVWIGSSAVMLVAWFAVFALDRASLATLFVLGLAIAVAGAWHHAFWNLYRANHISRFATNEATAICCTARVVDTPKTPAAKHHPLQPYLDGERTQFKVAMLSIRGQLIEASAGGSKAIHAWDQVSGMVRVFVNGRVTQVQAGDRVQIFGRLRRLSARRNPGGFSPLERGRSERIVCRLVANQPESVEVIAGRSAIDPRWWLESLHDGCRAALFQHMGEESASLAAAVLLGDREYLDPKQIDSFFVTGTVHLLAISGLHLAIIVKAFFFTARMLMLPRRGSIALVMILTVLYATLTGARPPVIRATVLVCMVCFELLYLRPRVSFNSLAAAGVVILALNPTSLFHAGVQLSFLAVATLIWLSRFERAMETDERGHASQVQLDNATLLPYLLSKMRRRAVSTALAGCAIWFISIPLVMHRFHLVPLSGLVLNLFLLVPLAVALYCGLLVICFAWVLPPIATVFGAGCQGCLVLITYMVGWAERFELAYGWVSGPTVLGLGLFYVLVVGFGAFQRYSRRWPVWLASAFAILVVTGLMNRAASAHRDGDVECAFLSVGHGVCIVLQLPNGQVWLYDAGSLGSTRSALREISGFLWAERITRLEGIILSHGDTDHFNVVPELLQRFEVGQICTSAAMLRSRDTAVAELMRQLNEGTVPVRSVASGARLSDSQWGSLIVRYPDADQFAAEDNANSVVLDVAYFGKRILLTGDLEGEGLARLLSTEPIDCDIMMAPHHGSRHSRPDEVARWCQPEWVVVSGGDPNSSRETAEVYRRAGATVLHTADQGAVTAVLSPNSVSVSSL